MIPWFRIDFWLRMYVRIYVLKNKKKLDISIVLLLFVLYTCIARLVLDWVDVLRRVCIGVSGQ